MENGKMEKCTRQRESGKVDQLVWDPDHLTPSSHLGASHQIYTIANYLRSSATLNITSDCQIESTFGIPSMITLFKKKKLYMWDVCGIYDETIHVRNGASKSHRNKKNSKCFSGRELSAHLSTLLLSLSFRFPLNSNQKE